MRLGLDRGLGLARRGGVAAVIPAVDLSSNFSDDFTGQTARVSLYTRTGWSAINSTAAADTNRARLFVENEAVGHTGAFGGNNYLVGRDLGSGALNGSYMRVRIPVTNPAVTYLVMSGVDEANCIGAKLISGVNVQWFKRVGGVETTVTLTATTVTASDIIEIFAYNLQSATPRLSVYKNGAPFLLSGGSIAGNSIAYNINATGSAAVIGQRCGFLTTGDFTKADDVFMSSMNGGVTITHTAAFYPSDFNNLGASASDYTGHDVPVSGTYSTTGLAPTSMQVRVVDELNGATQYQGWTDVTAFSAAAGAWSGNVRVLPTTNTARLEARFKNDTSIRGIASPTIAVGPTVMGYGQSNADFALTGTVPDTTVDVYRTRNTYSFDRTLQSGATTSTWKRNDNGFTSQVLARVLFDAFGFTAGVCGGGVGSQPATSLRKNSPSATFPDPYNGGALTSCYQLLTNNIVAARANGRIMSMFYDQGEAEGEQTGSDVNFTNYTTDVSGIFSDLRTDFAGGRNVLGLITMTGRGTGTLNPNQNTNWSGARTTQKAMTASIPNCIISHHNVGVLMSDAFHYASAANGKTEKHRRNGRSIAFALLGTGYKGSGPQTLTGTRSGAVITLPITANGATSYSALSGVDGTTAGSASALTSWEVSADNFATTLAITSVTLTGTDVVITLAATPGGAVKVRNYWGKNPDTTSWVFGTYSDGFKIALEPLVVPITVT